MNKSGFTLVELLAVIVILSLLTLLTSTAVTKLVKDAKNDLNSTQIELIKSAAQTWGADNLTGLPEAGKCSYLTLSNLKDYGLIDSNTKDLNTNEKLSEDLKIKISTKRNEKSGKLITTYEVNPKSIEGCYQQVYNNGEVVYFDVTNGVECSGDYTNSQSATGVKSGCMKFYAFNDDGGRKLNLLLDHNTTATVAWTNSSTTTNANGPIDLIEQLYNDTKDWNGTITPSDYTMDQRTQTSGAYYTIEYSKTPSYEGATTPYKARLITAQEIAEITGADTILNWDEHLMNSNQYYFDSLSTTASDSCKSGNITGCTYGWLYDRTSPYCITYGCLNNEDVEIFGYWTSSIWPGNSNSAWRVSADGGLFTNSVWSLYYGLRPVIEVLKSNL